MTRTRTSEADMAGAALDAAAVAIESLDLTVSIDTSGTGPAVRIIVDDRPVTLPVRAFAYCTGAHARQVVGEHLQPGRERPIVVADRITRDARSILTEAGWSWLDRRGRLHLRAPGVRIDTDVPNQVDHAPAARRAPISGRGGMTVAYWLCAHPERVLSPRRSAAELGVAPSTISTAVRHLVDAGLVDDDGRGLFPELFWELAAVWQPEPRWLASAPDPNAHRDNDQGAATWRRTGSAAALAYGAPIVTAGGEPVELYVPGPVSVALALRRNGSAEPGTGAAIVAVAPVAAVTAGPGDETLRPPDLDGWLAAPVLAVALDLAQDRARGREILADWRDPDAVWR